MSVVNVAAIEDDAICVAVAAARSVVERVRRDGGDIADAAAALEALYLEAAMVQTMPEPSDGMSPTFADLTAWHRGATDAAYDVVALAAQWAGQGRTCVPVAELQQIFIGRYLTLALNPPDRD